LEDAEESEDPDYLKRRLKYSLHPKGAPEKLLAEERQAEKDKLDNHTDINKERVTEEELENALILKKEDLEFDGQRLELMIDELKYFFPRIFDYQASLRVRLETGGKVMKIGYKAGRLHLRESFREKSSHHAKFHMVEGDREDVFRLEGVPGLERMKLRQEKIDDRIYLKTLNGRYIAFDLDEGKVFESNRHNEEVLMRRNITNGEDACDHGLFLGCVEVEHWHEVEFVPPLALEDEENEEEIGFQIGEEYPETRLAREFNQTSAERMRKSAAMSRLTVAPGHTSLSHRHLEREITVSSNDTS
jgi:hypothetical protein